MSLTPELQRRQNNTERVRELFQSRPMEWLTPRDIALAGGFAAWRSRLVEARLLVPEGWEIAWNGQNGSGTAYIYRPIPLGPEASTDRPQLSLGGWR